MPTNCKGRSMGIRLCGRCTSLAFISLALTWPASEPHANLRRGLGTSSLSRQPLHSDHPGSPAKEEVILRGQPAISAIFSLRAQSHSHIWDPYHIAHSLARTFSRKCLVHYRLSKPSNPQDGTTTTTAASLRACVSVSVCVCVSVAFYLFIFLLKHI